MSYDVWLEIDTGGAEPAALTDWNYTSNCGPMWRAAGANLSEFHGKVASECLPLLQMALALMRREPARFEAMNPDNGWGSYDTLLPALDKLAAQFAAHPKATVKVHR